MSCFPSPKRTVFLFISIALIFISPVGLIQIKPSVEEKYTGLNYSSHSLIPSKLQRIAANTNVEPVVFCIY